MSNLLKSKFLLGVLVVAAMAGGVALVGPSKAAADCSITTTLRVGSTGVEVQCLQSIVGATADGHFGPLTKAAVMAWQSGHGLVADGVVGPLTRAALMANAGMSMSFPAGCTSAVGYSTTTGQPCNSVMAGLPAGCTSTAGYSPVTGQACNTGSTLPAGCTSTAGYSPLTGVSCSTGTSSNNGALTGGAGSLDDVNNIGSLNNEDISEGATNAKVAGWTLTADNGSDLAITAVKLSFDGSANSGSKKLPKYADKVTVWQGSTKVGSADVADFSENNNVYSKTINLSGAVVKANQDSDFFVSVDALSSIDSANLGTSNNDWTITLDQVRFEDATGAILTDSSTGDLGNEVHFDFASVATATGLELNVKTTTGSSGDAVNKGHVVKVDDTSSTNDVPLLAFDLKATGDIQNIQDIPVQIDAVGTGHVTTIASGYSLWKDGVQIDTVNNSDLYGTDVNTVGAGGCDGTDDTCWIHFNDVDFNMSDGDTSHFVVKADLNDTAADFVVGDTLQATMDGTTVDAIDAEDQNGDAVTTGDLTGTATADAIAFYTDGLTLSFVSSTATISHTGDPANTGLDQDEGTYTITFDATAFGDDMTIDHDAPLVEASADANSESSLALSGTAGLTAIITSPSGADDGTNGFLVQEGTTERFTITAHVVPTASGYSRVSLNGVSYGVGSDTNGNVDYNFNLTNFKTSDLYLNNY